jgi:hypothetical protein
MSSNRLAPRWSIPGIGRLRPGYDAVRIVSSATVGSLKTRLPIANLKKASHKFDVVRFRDKFSGLRSEIRVTGTDDLSPWQILAKHEQALGSYRIVQVEIAFDIRPRARTNTNGDLGESAEDNTREKLFALVGLLAKPRHYREYLISVHEPELDPKPGYMAEPTFYFEDRRSSVALKSYCRYTKLRHSAFGGPCVRLEWTLKGKAAIERHLGGNKIKDLLSADLNKFAKNNLQLEEVDYVALGKLIGGLPLNCKSPPAVPPIKAKTVAERFKDPAYRSRRAVDLMLRNFAYRELAKFKDDWEHALWACQNSPAQIRGYLRRLKQIEESWRGQSRLTSTQKKGLRKRGRPRQRTRRRAISNHRINACFKRIQLEPV